MEDVTSQCDVNFEKKRMALAGVQPDSAVRTPDADGGAGKVVVPSQPRIDDRFLSPPKPGNVLADSTKPARSPASGSSPIIQTWKLQDAETDAKSGPVFAYGKSVQDPHPGGGLGETREPSRPPKHTAEAQGTSQKSATPGKSKEVIFDPVTHSLKQGTLERHLTDELRAHRGVVIEDTTRGGGNPVRVKEMCDKLATWISDAGAEVVYIRMVKDPVLLAWLVNHEASENGQPNRSVRGDPHFNKLVEKIILTESISRTHDRGDKADDRELVERKAESLVRMWRTLEQKGVEVRAWTNKIDKTRPYIIFGSPANAGEARLPIFHPVIDDDVNLKGAVTKAGNEVWFDPAVLGHQPKQPLKD
jgi:hypothetical protein